MEKPTWHDYFMGFAYLASSRSHDAQTKVGCVLVSDKKVISIGYNGFCSGVDDDSLPSKRPHKYPYMVHAEENAISNMVIHPPSAVAYITHMPCHRCAKLLWQNNIRTWYVPIDSVVHGRNIDDQIVYNHLVENGLEIITMLPDLSYLKNIKDKKNKEEQGILF
tara:strand:+ start:1080 stop:1571 length:492 start_codon:yes stop_codon:yes gene_type:complete